MKAAILGRWEGKNESSHIKTMGGEHHEKLSYQDDGRVTVKSCYISTMGG